MLLETGPPTYELSIATLLIQLQSLVVMMRQHGLRCKIYLLSGTLGNNLLTSDLNSTSNIFLLVPYHMFIQL